MVVTLTTQPQTPMDGTMNPVKTTISPVQLELELITSSNVLTAKNLPCGVMLDGLSHARLIPGLDASLCRCEACSGRANGGIWWFDSWMREQVLKRRTAYRFALTDGETLRDNADLS